MCFRWKLLVDSIEWHDGKLTKTVASQVFTIHSESHNLILGIAAKAVIRATCHGFVPIDDEFLQSPFLPSSSVPDYCFCDPNHWTIASISCPAIEGSVQPQHSDCVAQFNLPLLPARTSKLIVGSLVLLH